MIHMTLRTVLRGASCILTAIHLVLGVLARFSSKPVNAECFALFCLCPSLRCFEFVFVIAGLASSGCEHAGNQGLEGDITDSTQPV